MGINRHDRSEISIQENALTQSSYGLSLEIMEIGRAKEISYYVQSGSSLMYVADRHPFKLWAKATRWSHSSPSQTMALNLTSLPSSEGPSLSDVQT